MKQQWITPKNRFYNELEKTYKYCVNKYITEFNRITKCCCFAFRLNHYDFKWIYEKPC